MVNCSNHQVAFFRSVFCAKDDVLRLPEGLHVDKVDAVFPFVALALPRIEFKFHDSDLTNVPALRATGAASVRDRARNNANILQLS